MQKQKFRQNVAALVRYQNEYLACFRKDYGTWQSVQGGIEPFDLSPNHALLREMYEEIGVCQNDCSITYTSQIWRRYYFTEKAVQHSHKDNAGQDQLWFLVDLSHKTAINFEIAKVEFSKLEWVTLTDLINRYATWKKSVMYDFCRELNWCESTNSTKY